MSINKQKKVGQGGLKVDVSPELLPEGALLEYNVNGNYVSVAAIDPVTKIEVSMVGDARDNQDFLGRHAVRKLEYVLRKRKQQATSQDTTPNPPRKTDEGWFV